jgi:urease accessory protein
VLNLGLRQVGNRTVLHDCYAHVPLRVLRPVYPDDTGTAYLYLLNPCGGVLGGDTYSIHATLDAGAQAYITTPSATKLYAAPAQPACQHIDFTLQDGAVLTYLPEPTIPFANAAFRQHMTVRLGDGACAFLGEILAPGRMARDEIFAYREYRTSLRVEDARGDLLLIDRTCLYPQQDDLRALGMLEGYYYLGTFYALGSHPALDATLTPALSDLLDGHPHLVGSATTLAQGGIAIRFLADAPMRANQALYRICNLLHQQVLGQPVAPRRI